MFAIVGLGNPGLQYQQTRHNVGFWVIEHLAKKFVGDIFWKERFNCKVLQATISNQQVALVMPQKFMNLSGEAIQPLLHFHKIGIENLIVVHDDLDIKLGELKFKLGGSSAGHRGIENIIQVLGTSNFIRIKIGISHPRDSVDTNKIDVKDWVLQKPPIEQMNKLKEASQKAADALELLLAEGLTACQRKFL